MKKIIIELKYKSIFGFYFSLIIYKIYLLIFYRLFTDSFYLKIKYKSIFNKKLDIANPKSFNEKLQWYKINYKNSLTTNCSDKYEVRGYVKKTIGEQYLIPLLFHTNDASEINSYNLTQFPLIIKANHSSGENIIVKDKEQANWKKIQVDCRWWLSLNYYYKEKEWQYFLIKPKIIVEKLLLDTNGSIPFDYKLYYFSGKFEFLQIDLDRFGNHKRNLYDKDWNELPFDYKYSKSDIKVNRPENLDKLIELGQELSKPFPFVRVDFYIVNNKIYFGELTFHPEGGFGKFYPEDFDTIYGEKLALVNL